MKKDFLCQGLINYAETDEANRALITIVNVFSYGFIVFNIPDSPGQCVNTISTNISLRRREFAMLKSIGMTEKGFSKMMNYECLLYGIKGLMYGIPVSIGVLILFIEVLRKDWKRSFLSRGTVWLLLLEACL